MIEDALPRRELERLEAMVVEALDSRDDSALNILGYGEVSVALGWPVEKPQFVCKRTPPFTKAQFAAYQALVHEYIARLRQEGLDVVPTSIVPLDQGDKIISYLVQPMLTSGTLGHNVLKASEPDPDHPFLTALAATLEVVTTDAQY